jgi:hypothetical protein
MTRRLRDLKAATISGKHKYFSMPELLLEPEAKST